MDDESVRRRERLKAMRMEAADAEVSCNNGEEPCVGLPGSGLLSNPLIEEAEDRDSCATTRFDYYTDPMAAFVGNKRRNMDVSASQGHFTPSISNTNPPMPQFSTPFQGPRHHVRTPSPSHQFQANYSPDQRIWQVQGPSYSHGPNRSSPGMVRPFPMYGGNPEVWNGSRPTGSYGFPSNQSGGNSFPRPGSGQMGTPGFRPGQGRAHWLNNSPCPSSGPGGSPGPGSGRGRFGRGMTPDSGRSGGRGVGFGGRFSTSEKRLGPEQLYLKSMVEDPWKFLKPVLLKLIDPPTNSLNTPNSSKSWIPQSISTKKPRVSEASINSSSQQSLAEYLASSFNGAISEEPNT